MEDNYGYEVECGGSVRRFRHFDDAERFVKGAVRRLMDGEQVRRIDLEMNLIHLCLSGSGSYAFDLWGPRHTEFLLRRIGKSAEKR